MYILYTALLYYSTLPSSLLCLLHSTPLHSTPLHSTLSAGVSKTAPHSTGWSEPGSIYIYIYIYIHSTLLYIHTYIHTHIHTYILVHVARSLHADIYIYIYIYSTPPVQTKGPTRQKLAHPLHVCVYVCMCVCMYVCIYVCTLRQKNEGKGKGKEMRPACGYSVQCACVWHASGVLLYYCSMYRTVPYIAVALQDDWLRCLKVGTDKKKNIIAQVPILNQHT